MSIDDALTEPSGSVFRCPDCHGEVRPFKKFLSGTRAHFEHIERFEKCRRSGNTYDLLADGIRLRSNSAGQPTTLSQTDNLLRLSLTLLNGAFSSR
jgi:predicted RNA-binding Zn-ribbon protein involved in translation (DUF1610 family)